MSTQQYGWYLKEDIINVLNIATALASTFRSDINYVKPNEQYLVTFGLIEACLLYMAVCDPTCMLCILLTQTQCIFNNWPENLMFKIGVTGMIRILRQKAQRMNPIDVKKCMVPLSLPSSHSSLQLWGCPLKHPYPLCNKCLCFVCLVSFSRWAHLIHTSQPSCHLATVLLDAVYHHCGRSQWQCSRPS